MDTYGTPAIIEDLFSQLFKKKGIDFNKDSLGGYLVGVSEAFRFIEDDNLDALLVGWTELCKYFETKYGKRLIESKSE